MTGKIRYYSSAVASDRVLLAHSISSVPRSSESPEQGEQIREVLGGFGCSAPEGSESMRVAAVG